MYTTNQTSPTRALDYGRAGFALAVALVVLLLLSILVVTVFANAMASFRSGMTDLGESRTYYAAEAGAEALEDAVIEHDELDMITAFNSSAVLVTPKAQAIPVSTFRGSEGNRLREEVYRSALFIGTTLERDIQAMGVGIESEIRFGTLSTFNDTLVVLYVPWIPAEAFPYEISPPPGVNNPLDPGGTCGANCIDLKVAPDGTFDLERGDLARLQINAERRVILITDVNNLGATVEVTFSADTTLLHYESAFKGGVQLDRFSTIVQKLQPIVYYVEGEILYRADRFEVNGSLKGSPLAYGVKSWETKMIFVDLDEADEGNPDDADNTNEFDDILGARITAVLGSNRPDIRVAGGQIFTRDYEWKLIPRNLAYERSR